MKKGLKLVSIFFIVGVLFCLQVNAETIYADSCSREDIYAAYENASDGDTIMIPAGDCTWTSPYYMNINKVVSLIGAGTSQTILRVNVSAPEALFEYHWFSTQTYEDVEIAHFTIIGPGPGENLTNSLGGVSMWAGPRNFKVHDMVFQDLPSFGLQIKGEKAGNIPVGNPTGVIYNCSFINCYKPGTGYGVHVGGYDPVWNESLVLGNSEAVFIEDNYFSECRHSVAAGYSAKYVFRYNTIMIDTDKGGNIDAHGNRLTGYRGTRSYEIYENTLYTPEPYSYAINIRGGDGVIFNNTMTNFTGDRIIYLCNEACTNNGGGGYPKPDQIRDTYVWENTNNASPVDGVGSLCTENGELIVLEGRDFYNEEKSGYTPYMYPHPLRSSEDVTSPSTPTNLTATAVSSSQINLSWNASTDNVGVVGYRIYRNGIYLATTASTSYSDTSLSASTTYTYRVSAYDAANNEAPQSSSASATTLSTPSLNGNGGDGGGGTITTPTVQETHSELDITSETPEIIEDINKETGIKQIQIEVHTQAENVEITVTKYDDNPANISVLKTGKVYKYLQIEAENLNDNLNKSIITIQVEKNWTSENNIKRDDIVMLRFNESYEIWNELETNYTEEDETYYYYDVELDSFSYFAIAAKGDRIKEIIKSYWLWVVVALIVVILVIIIIVIYKYKRRQPIS